MSAPRVSVLLPVRDGALFLREAVESVLAQTLDDFELIVVDDGSEDETPAILGAVGRAHALGELGLWADTGEAHPLCDAELAGERLVLGAARPVADDLELRTPV